MPGGRARPSSDVTEIIKYLRQDAFPIAGSSRRRPAGDARLALFLFAVASSACSVQTEDFNSNESVGSVHAVLRVRRVDMVDGSAIDAHPQGEALAAFVRVPPSVDPDQLLRVTGLWPQHPDIGQCAISSNTTDATLDEDESGELIAAQSVNLVTQEGVHALAPHAFPSAYDLLRGVLFSSRDQSALGLPEDQAYELKGQSIDISLPAVDVSAFTSSPKLPTGVRISNRAFDEGTELPLQAVLDFSWNYEAGTSDLVVISITAGALHYQCTFNDAEGFGSVPLTANSGQSVWAPGASAQVAVHRVRETTEGHAHLAQIKAGFDFSIEKTWTLSDGAPHAFESSPTLAEASRLEHPEQ